jgi:hypothetical protein
MYMNLSEDHELPNESGIGPDSSIFDMSNVDKASHEVPKLINEPLNLVRERDRDCNRT